ncbi:Protein kinase, partial [Globisporangium splendens]
MASDFPDAASGLVNVPDDPNDDSLDSEQHGDVVHTRLQFHTWEVCVSYLVMFLFCAGLLKYTAFINQQLNAGDIAFKPKAILPTFRALLWLFACVALVLICFNIVLIFVFSNNDRMSLDIYLALLYAGRHFMLVLAPSFMRQKSLSGAALMRSSFVAFGITFGTLMLFAVPHFPSYVELYISFGVVLLYFCRMALWPALRASVAVMRRYAVFCLIHVVLSTAHVVCAHVDIANTGSPFSSISSVWAAMTPIFVWQLLKSDTEYWRGKGARSIELQQLFSKRIKATERVSAEGLHVLIEMHRKHVIDFSSLDLRQQIGEGFNSTVYSAMMGSKVPVSVKVYTPVDLSDEVIAEYSQEAALCGNLEHPNITRFYGLSVCPPTISLVFELCRGSLKEISVLIDEDYGCKLLIKITQMLDAARAIAYLHSFSPPFIHREISLASFLIDVHGVVKLSGFGDSRILNQFTAPKNSQQSRLPLRSLSATGVPWEERAGGSPYDSFDSLPTDAARKVSYHPPFSERIDVYALGMAFWQLLHPKVELPKPGSDVYRNPEWRPHFTAIVPDDIRELIESTWAEDTRARPTAAQVVKSLELIQQKSLAENLDCVGTAVDTSHLGAESSIYHEMIDGADAVRNLVSTNQVKRTWEGVRLGNAWMEAGFLHEEKHSAPFKNKPNMRYYFNTMPLQNDSILFAEDESVIVIGMSASSYDSRWRSHSLAPSRPKRCMCKMNARQVAAPRRTWKAFGTAELRVAAQHDFTLSSSYESLLTSVLLEDSGEEK